jgi:hypothetical protein
MTPVLKKSKKPLSSLEKSLLKGVLNDLIKQQKMQGDLIRQYAPRIEQAIKPAMDSFNRYKDKIAEIQETAKNLMSYNRPLEVILPPPGRSQETVMTKKNAEMIAEVMEKRFEKYFVKPKKKGKKISIYLGDDCTLYRNPKNKYHCKLEGAIQIGILKGLTDKFIETELLRDKVGSKTVKSVRKLIGEINRKAKYGLHIDKLIEGNRGKGYRLNQKYKITA